MSHELGIERGSVTREGSTSYERERDREGRYYMWQCKGGRYELPCI